MGEANSLLEICVSTLSVVLHNHSFQYLWFWTQFGVLKHHAIKLYRKVEVISTHSLPPYYTQVSSQIHDLAALPWP
jgi:hypothetical protein